MDGQDKLVVLAVCLTIICLTIVYCILFIVLWQYRQIIGLTLVAILLTAACVFMRGKLKEQDLREVRYRHHEETPLDDKGEPMFWQDNYQANPHRH